MTTENEQLVQQTMAQLIGDGGVAAVEHLVSEDFRHYRPEGLVRTKSEWLADISRSLLSLEGMQVEILHLLSDGDYVVIHTRRRLPDGKPGIVVVDILRIADGQFTEVWELVEPVASAQAHLTWWEL
ncbi:nuclear transport factor 2 family protein [Kribbella albertanoniae]|uniref:Nuclear transport factor 2 family protein n=1 Tax=Kribbella albertanoniae TaxID=1266829 RepID=A0A4V2XMN1_9ACTN|nr:nuclear transport factor 2 family protein [Kribbella albertanoniae]TDC14926.1 nuclear transport factor 2 family protein [Kribbella albertanoniae]